MVQSGCPIQRIFIVFDAAINMALIANVRTVPLRSNKAVETDTRWRTRTACAPLLGRRSLLR
jgi:hypothetical protein